MTAHELMAQWLDALARCKGEPFIIATKAEIELIKEALDAKEKTEERT